MSSDLADTYVCSHSLCDCWISLICVILSSFDVFKHKRWDTKCSLLSVTVPTLLLPSTTLPPVAVHCSVGCFQSNRFVSVPKMRDNRRLIGRSRSVWNVESTMLYLLDISHIQAYTQPLFFLSLTNSYTLSFSLMLNYSTAYKYESHQMKIKDSPVSLTAPSLGLSLRL